MANEYIEINGRQVGDSNPCFIIAEVAQSHDGSLGMAYAFTDAAAKAGADAIKFQTHIADAESTQGEPWRIKFSKQDNSRFDYWKRMEFTEDQWKGLKQHAEEKGLVFLSSPFSAQAIDMLNRIGMPAWKVPSGEINNLKLLELMSKTGSPVLLSSGISDMKELTNAVNFCRKNGADVAVFQCTTAYPCPPEKIGINLLQEFKETFKCPIGLSDHSSKIYSGLAAVTKGACLLEVHVTFSDDMFGPDVSSSLNFSEFSQLIEGVRFIEKMMSHPVNKDAIAVEMEPLRQLFTKSIVIKSDLSKGTILSEEHFEFKKPGTGIPAARMSDVVGMQLKVDLQRNSLLSYDDII
ncbi:N-acetylneuraminate synthase family protein [Oceanospirillaceae bacterium]|nr:N-acetylneuraminate synthase family protein [Oceanospirillaceae bacterium]